MAASTSRPIKAAPKTTNATHQQGKVRATASALNPITVAKTLLPIRNTPVQQIAFYGAVGALAAAEVIEAPIAVLIVGGHLLHRSRNPIAESLGEALDDAS